MTMPALSTLRFGLFLTLVGAAAAQQPMILVDQPTRLYESTVQADFTITARQIANEYPALVVLLDHVDVTSQVGWTWSNEKRVDVNLDGWLESFRGTAELDLSQLSLSHGQTVSLEATANGSPGSPVSCRGGVRVRGHAVVIPSPSYLNANSPRPELSVYLRQWGVPVAGTTYTLKVFKDGLDITSTTIYQVDVLTAIGLGGGMQDWNGCMRITTSSLGALAVGTGLVVQMDTLVPGLGGFTGSANFNVGDDPVQSPCLDQALCAFIAAASINQGGPGTPVTTGTIDKKALRDATDALKAAIRACQTAAQQTSPTSYDSVVDCGDGVVVDVTVDVGGNGTPGSPNGGPATGGALSTENKLIISIGGDAAPGSNGAGGTGNAFAGSGSVAIAAGGSGAGKGQGGFGFADVTGTGAGHSFGGSGGGAAGRGGSAFTNCLPTGVNDLGSGTASGGPGGYTTPGSTGGHGGGAGTLSNANELSQKPPGAKSSGAGGPGKHGSGSCATADPDGNGDAERGTSLDNG